MTRREIQTKSHISLNFELINNKQLFNVFLFNIRNYSPEVINIQRRKSELNIILSRMNNFDIK